MNHKRGRPKDQRAGCLMCKPNKMRARKRGDRTRGKRRWREVERIADQDGARGRIRRQETY